MALVEDSNGSAYTTRYNLPTPSPLLRLLLQQSNCFRVVDRSAGLAASEREQGLAARGFLCPGQTVRKQQVVEAQYSLLTSVVFSEQNAGDTFGGLIAQIPVLNRFSGLIGNVDRKEAQTAIFLTDNEPAEQVASATGAARETDLPSRNESVVRGSSKKQLRAHLNVPREVLLFPREHAKPNISISGWGRAVDRSVGKVKCLSP